VLTRATHPGALSRSSAAEAERRVAELEALAVAKPADATAEQKEMAKMRLIIEERDRRIDELEQGQAESEEKLNAYEEEKASMVKSLVEASETMMGLKTTLVDRMTQFAHLNSEVVAALPKLIQSIKDEAMAASRDL
jgi:chromosome segregation ATPase